MRITVSNIPESGIEEELRVPIAIGDIKLKEDVRVFLKASRFGSKVLVEGRFTSVAFVICSRCLEEFSFPIEDSFSIEYIPYGELAQGKEHELTKEDLDISFYHNDEINVEDLIREQILLSVPMKPLCKSDCQGICPECGTNLNETPIHRSGCSSEKIDHRLTPLKKLKESLKGN